MSLVQRGAYAQIQGRKEGPREGDSRELVWKMTFIQLTTSSAYSFTDKTNSLHGHKHWI